MIADYQISAIQANTCCIQLNMEYKFLKYLYNLFLTYLTYVCQFGWMPQDVRVHFAITDLITQTGYESKQLAKTGPGK